MNKLLGKLCSKYIFSIVILAFLSNLIWIIELLYHGWDGLTWLSYFHYALIIIPILFFLWLTYICYNLNVKINILFYVVMYIIFFVVFRIILFFQTISGPSAIPVSLYFSDTDLAIAIIGKLFYIGIVLQCVLIYIVNIIICLYEKKKITVKDIIIISSHIIIIPIVCVIVSFIILFLLKLNYMRYTFEPIHWVKTGSIIFSFIIYECSFIYYIKKEKSKQKDNM
ncbi:MAG: hypothetical protein FWD28_01175 [Treponema sp.]|nr:hypothetical protein [Treponema sp.]